MCLPVKPFKIEREWTHAGLLCNVVLNQEAGHRCGYVRVPPGHKMHGAGYDDVNVEVHGGLTFAAIEPCAHEDGIGYWFGFDCAHGGDVINDPNPDYNSISDDARKRLNVYANIERRFPALHDRDHYWSHDEVVRETERLAEQLAEL